MFKSQMMLAAVLSGALLVGCEKEESKKVPPTPTTPAAPTAAAPAAPAVPAAPATPAVPATPSASTPTVAAPTLNSPSSLEPPAIPATPSTPTTPPVTTTTPNSADADAGKILADFQSHLSAKKWDECGKDLKKLTAMKDKLSPQLTQAIESAKASLTAAKAADSLQIPGLGTSTPEVKTPDTKTPDSKTPENK